ncbi:tetratricopeptide repeat protein [Leucobacter sp. cx-328]|uniref:tetratricopeptide repeat protein n=1 Tax=unclassified Leucobacter TaxID=2621730 RepID=UPI00165DB790|nr:MULTISPECIES: tetratricopeptide repeat protein [unclassified Leucobacter]MBC9943839.1 tetratricopeptide repeat protein [Leucobacter sp. cx-328]
MTEQSWDDRVDAFWASADDAAPESTLEAMRVLVAERPATDAAGIYEWASVHDFLGLEAEAIPLYMSALAAGLDGEHKPQALIQLGSSLRNVGRADEAVDLLTEQESNEVTGDAAQAFLALALHTAGNPDEALRVALTALAPTLPMYRGAITYYANEL